MYFGEISSEPELKEQLWSVDVRRPPVHKRLKFATFFQKLLQEFQWNFTGREYQKFSLVFFFFFLLFLLAPMAGSGADGIGLRRVAYLKIFFPRTSVLIEI